MSRGKETSGHRWAKQDVEALTAAYLGGARRSEIASRLGVPVMVVARKIHQLQLASRLSDEERSARSRAVAAETTQKALQAAAERGWFVWTESQVQQLVALYVREGLSVTEIASRIGCRPRDVSRKASQLKLRYQRPESITQAHWKAARDRAREIAVQAIRHKAKAENGDRGGPVEPPAQSDADLIAAAIAAGRVTRLPAGHACGTTRWEAALGTLRPVRALSSADQRQRGQNVAAARARSRALAGGV